MRTPTWAPSERAAYLQSGEWNLEFRPGGRGHLGVLKSERVLLCRKNLVWELSELVDVAAAFRMLCLLDGAALLGTDFAAHQVPHSLFPQR